MKDVEKPLNNKSYCIFHEKEKYYICNDFLCYVSS